MKQKLAIVFSTSMDKRKSTLSYKQLNILKMIILGMTISFCWGCSGANAATLPQQSISSMAPTSGSVGTVVVIKGSGFIGSNQAWVGNAHDATIKVVSNTQVNVTIPKDATTGAIGILNANHAAFTPTSFTITTPTLPQPAISSFSPSSGVVGTVITMIGSGFTGATQAWIGTAKDASMKVISDTQVQITVPKDAVTGQIAVLNSSHSAFSATSFTVNGTIPVVPPITPPLISNLAVHVLGKNFIDINNKVVQLRGVNFSGFEFVAIQGWDPSDPSGGGAGQPNGPNWSAMQSWKVNTVRLPLNEASWLGYSCTDTSGVVHNPDPGSNYKSAVETQVSEANAAGLYVILDLHWAAPGNYCPMLQSQMADNDHSIVFWTSIANTFKNNPAILFELFNEPYFNFDFTGNQWSYMMNGTGGSFTGFPATSNSGQWENVQQTWLVASYQAMINAVRATGATNIVLVGTMQYSQDLSEWLANQPSDSLHQMAAAWHPYPTYGTTFGTAAYAQPNYSPEIFTEVQQILSAGIPVIATETGDQDTAGTTMAPLVSNVTTFADANGVSVLGWTWDVWSDPSNVLIQNFTGSPTDGYGQVFQSWLFSH